MIGAVAAGSKKRAASVTLDDIYARHTWLYWFDASNGVNVGAGTWTDRVSGYVLTASGLTLSATTMGGQPAIRAQGASGGYLLGPGVQVRPFRVFMATASADTSGDQDSAAWQVYDDVSAHSIRARSTAGAVGWVLGGTDTSSRDGSSWDDGSPRVLRHEYNAANASHVLRVNGSAYSTASDTADATLADASAGTFFCSWVSNFLAPSTIDMTHVVICGIGHSSINDTQAAQVETDLLTIMGL